MNVMEVMQKQFQDAAEKLQTVQKEYSKALADRQTLDSQLNENKQVPVPTGVLSEADYHSSFPQCTSMFITLCTLFCLSFLYVRY
jgi:hypothetical protein